MPNPFENDELEYLVLQNDEGQYSLWPAFRAVPEGWSVVGPKGSRAECVQYIEQTWTDMRPRSLARESDATMPHGASASNDPAVH